MSKKIGTALIRVMCLLLFIAAPNYSWSAVPAPCLSQKYSAEIEDAVSSYWRDFKEASWWRSQMCAESRFNPDAKSPVGAEGLAQIMPATYANIVRDLKWDSSVSAFNPERAIRAGSYYQGNSRRAWNPEKRTPKDRNDLGLCSYNRGFGNCIKDQRECGDGVLWSQIAPCTALHTLETINYINKINEYHDAIISGHLH